MADIGEKPAGEKLETLRKQALYHRHLTRLVDMDVRREEIRIELERLEQEEATIRKSIDGQGGVKNG